MRGNPLIAGVQPVSRGAPVLVQKVDSVTRHDGQPGPRFSVIQPALQSRLTLGQHDTGLRQQAPDLIAEGQSLALEPLAHPVPSQPGLLA